MKQSNCDLSTGRDAFAFIPTCGQPQPRRNDCQETQKRNVQVAHSVIVRFNGVSTREQGMIMTLCMHVRFAHESGIAKNEAAK
jgi:hypothetical protein